jgi:PAS domain S-box-containing protein
MSSRIITVLHVDDSQEFANLVREFLQTQNDDISVITCLSADDALTRLDSGDGVDCIVSDCEMPMMDGLELLETVRKQWPTLPFILFTGKGDEETAMTAINLGVTDYLQKNGGTSQYAILANRIRNVVAQHRAETNLKEVSEQTEVQFKLLIDAVEDYAIFLIDTDGRVQTWNSGAEKLKGYTGEEILGEQISVFYREEDRNAGVPDRYLDKAAAEEHITYEGWRVRKDGSEFWAYVTLTALRVRGDLIGYAKVTRDDSTRHREQQLAEQNEQLTDILATISHDLQNPLNVAMGKVELTMETEDLSHLDTVLAALTRASELIVYLGKLIETDGQMVNSEPVDLREVAEAAWTSVKTEQSTLRIEGTTMFAADRQGVMLLLENLFKNAIDHAGPEVSIRIRLIDGGFAVEDDGPGVPESERTRIFEMGYSSDPDGTGLGLAICKQRAIANGWSLEATEGSGGGARFVVSGITAA